MPYFPYNPDGQSKFAPQAKSQFLVNVDKNQIFNIPNDRDGDYPLRVLPAWSEEGAFAISTENHYNVGVPAITFRCTNVEEPGSCPFCKVYSSLRNEYEKYKVDLSVISAKRRFYSNVINLAQPQLGPLVWPYGKTIFTNLLKNQNSGKYGDLFHPETGHDITISRTKNGKRTDDTVLYDPNPTKLQDMTWLDRLHNLDNILPECDFSVADKAFKSHAWQVYRPNIQVQVPKSVARDDDIPEFKVPPSPVKAQVPAQAGNSSKSDAIEDLERRLAELNAEKLLRQQQQA